MVEPEIPFQVLPKDVEVACDYGCLYSGFMQSGHKVAQPLGIRHCCCNPFNNRPGNPAEHLQPVQEICAEVILPAHCTQSKFLHPLPDGGLLCNAVYGFHPYEGGVHIKTYKAYLFGNLSHNNSLTLLPCSEEGVLECCKFIGKRRNVFHNAKIVKFVLCLLM